MEWFYLGVTLGTSAAAGFLALRRQSPSLVWVSGSLVNVAGALACWHVPPRGIASLLSIQAICLACSALIWILLDAVSHHGVPHYRLARRPLVFARAAVLGAIVVTGLVAAQGIVGFLRDEGSRPLRIEAWLALLATGAALAAGARDSTAERTGAGLYFWGLLAVGLGQIQRGFAPSQYFLWGSVCDLAGFVLVAALLGWAAAKLRPGAAPLPDSTDVRLWSNHGFRVVQALLLLSDAMLAVWIAATPSFDGLGAGVALFGLAGRLVACPAALMLLGTAILMAWQSRGGWRRLWQYAALALGMLFTTSIGWATMDAATASPWLQRSVNLLISASMMTLMSGLGLKRVLPRHSDWIARGRQAMPVFATLALLLAVMLVARRSG